MKYLISILSYVILVQTSDEFKPRHFHFFCYDYLSFNINHDGVEEVLPDRSIEGISRNFQAIEIVYEENKRSQISVECDGSGNTSIRIQDKNGICDVFGTIPCTNLSPMFQYEFKDISFIIGSDEDTRITVKTPDFKSDATLIIESDFFTNVLYKGDSIFYSKNNFNISYGNSHNTELVLRHDSTGSILSISNSFGDFNISEEGSSEQLIRLKNGGTFDLKFEVDFSYMVYLRKEDQNTSIKERSWYNIFGYFY
ncbi:hypothetical protein P3W45_000904 [Vairimorpha bombi]|jgi:hypothetical protein